MITYMPDNDTGMDYTDRGVAGMVSWYEIGLTSITITTDELH